MNKKVSLGLTISIAALAAAMTFIITLFFSLRHFNDQVRSVKEKAAKYERLEAVDSYVRQNFYTDLDEEAIMDGILKGYMSGLHDKYSHYMTAEEYKELQQTESGQFVGIGVTVTVDEDGYIHILEVEKNSPAETSGLQPDDRVVAIEGEDVLAIGYAEAINRVKGEEGTTLSITVRRDEQEQDYSIVRKTFEVTTVEGRLFGGGIGYISISNFRENTPEQFRQVMEDLIANGAESMIFDVRDNGGGLLRSLEEMLDPMLPEGVIAVATYQDGSTETAVYSDAAEMDIPMVVLVNENSASAAELFAASLKDFDKATLVGTTTFGKGIMQVTTPLKDGGGLTLTIATYQTTRSDCYHGVGVVPDIEVAASEDTDIDDADPETDPQLAKAIEILK